MKKFEIAVEVLTMVQVRIDELDNGLCDRTCNGLGKTQYGPELPYCNYFKSAMYPWGQSAARCPKCRAAQKERGL